MKRFGCHLTEKSERIAYVHHKTAKIDYTRGLYNPSSNAELAGLLNKSKSKILRFAVFPAEQTVYVWDAHDSDHAGVAMALGYRAIDSRWKWGIVTVDDGELMIQVEGGKSTIPVLYKYAPGFKGLYIEGGVSYA